MANYDKIHEASIRFCNAFRSLSDIVGGISITMRNDLIEMYCLENDTFDQADLEAIILETLPPHPTELRLMYKIEKYSGEATLKHYFPELFENEIEEMDIEKIYEVFKSILIGEDKKNFLASFDKTTGDGWFLQVSRDKTFWFWGDGPGWNDVICVYKKD